MLLGRGIRLLVVLGTLGIRDWNKSRARNGSSANCRADQESAASCIMLGHVCFLPMRFKPGFPG